MRELSAIITILLLILSSTSFSQRAKSDSIFASKQDNKAEKMRKKYASWDSCFIIKAKGDTIYGKIDHREDQSSEPGNHLSDMLIFFLHPNGKKEQFIPNNIKELYLYEAKEGFKKYLTLEDEFLVTDYGMLYRVIVDGECKLIANRIKYFQVSDNLGVVPQSSLNFPNEGNEFSVFYKKKFWTAGSFFKKKNKCAVADCSELIEQIEKKNFSETDFAQLVEEFNKCIATKK